MASVYSRWARDRADSPSPRGGNRRRLSPAGRSAAMFKLTGEDIDLEWVRQVMEEHFTPRDYQEAQELILPSLQEVQERYGYISEEAVSIIAAHLDISETRIFGTMSFYNDFRLHKPGKHVLLICKGMACHVVGSQKLIDNVVLPRLGIGEKETTPEGEIT